jgi:hypothetical protein
MAGVRSSSQTLADKNIQTNEIDDIKNEQTHGKGKDEVDPALPSYLHASCPDTSGAPNTGLTLLSTGLSGR